MSVTLLGKLERELQTTFDLIDAFEWENKNKYADYIAQTYFYTSHSVRLIGSALMHTSVSDSALFNYFANHVKEEQNHEKLALADLKRLGFSIDDFNERSSCRLMWQSQYYYPHHAGSHLLLGYIIALELLALHRAPSIVERVSGGNVKSSPNKFMRVHAEEDVHHVKLACDLIDSLPCEKKEQVIKNFHQGLYSYRQLLLSIEADYE
ncbi:hypothetical protein DZ860_15395 [Vibrio sinensis]|uniref:Iron-containing redox enzyme family protein n=1 Tax=Vibrio sinensis TaxID=2302434 RepID=A0A3A6QLN9_9VIBR|nr:iron-containing redox enzyme family protein [Vibrio sinensis]RJX69368.1 hypothetical protein DZ860_15395 [Vibrio sinensis]